MDALRTITTRQTPQSSKARPEQVKNAAGGYSFQVGDAERLRRFLILGTESGTYYTSEEAHTRDNAAVVMRMAANRPMDLINEIVAVSTAGRAPRVNPAIFALAVACSPTTNSDQQARMYALSQLTQVCRIPTHLFMFVRYVEQFRGWGPAVAKAVGRWYTVNPVDRLAYHLVKFRQRDGDDHVGVLRRAHPKVDEPARRMAINWAVGKGLNDYPFRVRSSTQAEMKAGSRADGLPAKLAARPKLDRASSVFDELAIIVDFEDAQKATKVAEWVAIVNRGNGLSWEMLPDAAVNEPAVWEALLHSERGVPQQALIKQLPRLSRLGLCDGDTGRLICAQIKDPVRLKKARVHPINLMIAQKTYAQGYGMRGRGEWPVVSNIVDALHDGFPAAYGAVEPANVRVLMGLDVSGSMSFGQINGVPLQPREACGALATVAANTEPDVSYVGFTTGAWRLDISKRRRLDDTLEYLRRQPSGGTDCSLPMRFAIENNMKVDLFVVLTDGESWYGAMHPFQALERYREKSGINARLVSVAMTATGTSISRPDDALTLDVVGFDTSVPQMVADFGAGRL